LAKFLLLPAEVLPLPAQQEERDWNQENLALLTDLTGDGTGCSKSTHQPATFSLYRACPVTEDILSLRPEDVLQRPKGFLRLHGH
jgi:hypothetical protein